MIHVLSVSADPHDLEYYKKLNAANEDIAYEQLMPNLPGDIIQQLSEQLPDVVILSACEANWGKEDFILQLIERFPKMAFILSCDKNQESKAIAFISKGVQDYFVKEKLDAYSLRKCVLTAVIRRNLRIELLNYHDKEAEAREYSSRLLARMSHEIRTPMNAVIGMTEILWDSELNSKQRYYLQLIKESGNMLVSLFNDLLDFSKIESGKVKIHARPFSLCQSMQEVIESVLPQALEKKLNLLLHISPELPKIITGDDLRLRQVMMNLVENAIKFTDTGFVKVHVFQNETEQGAVLHLVVADTGQGIKEEVIPQLFKPYVKGAEHEAAQIKGVGLGLSICDHLVKRMKGQIKVESVLEKGTTFTVILPLIQVEKQPVSRQLNAFKDKKILYITHNQLHDELLKAYCAYWGAALKIQREEQDMPVFGNELEAYDLLITDLRSNLKLDLKLIDSVRSKHEIAHILVKDRENVNDQLIVIRKDTVILLQPIFVDELFETIDAVLNSKADILNRRDHLPQADEHMAEYHPIEILVAEDNAINQKIILGVLSRYGYSPRLVENGKQALESILIKTYDLVLMDIQMPVMNGLEATKLIRQRVPAELQPRIIALTADALQKSSDEYKLQGMDDVLYKPVQTKELLKVLTDTNPREINIEPDLY
ncbi:MAG: ATP-binding protein [Bacteroidetes bacterium]|jgi:signal transduction histidine kinase/CheY-like chemotaxis protein|nr:ATP-binding protein [Bacteroidota bacterium]